MPRRRVNRKQENDSDDSDTKAETPSPKPKPADTEIEQEKGAGAGVGFTRKTRGRNRFAGDDSSDEDQSQSKPSVAASADESKRAREERRKRLEQLKLAKEAKAEQDKKDDEISKAEDEAENDDGRSVEADENKDSVLHRKTSRRRTRFDSRESSLETPFSYTSAFAGHPEHIPWVPVSKRIQQEKEVLFSLAGRGENILEKARNDMRRQGLYVAHEKEILSANVERAVRRIRMQQSMAAKDGVKAADDSQEKDDHDKLSAIRFPPREEIFVTPFDPLEIRRCRPTMRYDPSAMYLQYDMVVPVQNMEAVFGSREHPTVLEIEFSSLTLKDHHLFSKEDYLVAELESLWRKYQYRTEMKWVDFYSQKISSAKAALETIMKEKALDANNIKGLSVRKGRRDKGKEDVKESVDKNNSDGDVFDSVQKEPWLHEELSRLRIQKSSEELEDLKIVSRMIQIWDEVKKTRQAQGFTNTKCSLKFKKQLMDKRKDEEEREEELEAELSEMRRQHEHTQALQRTKHEKDCKTLENKVKTMEKKIKEFEEKEAQLLMAERPNEDEDLDDEDDDDDNVQLPAMKSNAQDKKFLLRLQSQLKLERDELSAYKNMLETLRAKEDKGTEKFDVEAAKKAIRDRQERTKRSPGDPIYLPVLTYTAAKTETDALPQTSSGKSEAMRRKKLKDLKIIVRLSVNGNWLKDDEGNIRDIEFKVANDFTLKTATIETIRLLMSSKRPEVTIHVLEDSGFLERVRTFSNVSEFASVFLPVAEDFDDANSLSLTFQATVPSERPWCVEIEPQTTKINEPRVVRPSGLHYNAGEVFIRVSKFDSNADEDSVKIDIESDNLLETNRLNRRSRSDVTKKAKGLISVNKLKRLVEANELDPNDPRNRNLLELLSASKETESNHTVRFDGWINSTYVGDNMLPDLRLQEHSVHSHRWVGEQFIKRPANVRHKLLMTRQNQLSAVSIPLLESDIPDDDIIDKIYVLEFPQTEDSDQKMSERKKVQRIMRFKEKVQEQVSKAKARQGQRLRRVYRHEDVVHQPRLPHFGVPDILAGITNLLRKRSALRPQVGQLPATIATPSQCYISISVQRAQNLPIRHTNDSKSIAPPLECVVEARFGKQVETTTVFKGNNPAWNAKLKLKFEPPSNNWSPSNLMKVEDKLYLTVFDTKVYESEKEYGKLRKVEKRWLGSISFPFNTLYIASAKGRVDGTFELDAPPHIIGYTRAERRNLKAGRLEGEEAAGESQGQNKEKENRKSSLQVCIALDPPLSIPGSLDREVEGRLPSQPKLDQRVKNWILECKGYNRDRNFEALWRSLQRDWVLGTRFLCIQEPPPDLVKKSLGVHEQMLQLLRFVSLIPFLEDFHLEDHGDDIDIDSLNVWCTSSEFIDIMAGDWEEHASLLCNFFLHVFKHNPKLEASAYLVFGNGIPEGETIYVMTIGSDPNDSEKIYLWNASKGSVYHSKDPYCTLKEIHFVVDQHNIWGNIQQTRDIRYTSFDLTDTKAWRPLFNDKFPIQNFHADTVQESIDWKPLQKHDAYADEVRKEVEQYIRGHLETLRANDGRMMIEAANLSKKLSGVLKRMEIAANYEGTFTEEDLQAELSGFMQQNEVIGFYINRPYTDIEPIIHEIESSNIHRVGPAEANEKDTQFAIAVHVRVFPRRVTSLWVAVACLVRKKP
ncbi:hypothetical protein GUITHDRAFT_163401 [Guillardia theta CCMP2712]|uniref:C2 domain-containing protein n=3 Tax=Guillardia theta TaxID=55529 RepID=L1JAA0_GUITC|nr:hypothetical protein GUITHDRAFT_163401 [Guillardia theta CCMP2712]EKX45015.1 hypothetical protein GUITHDRAFT_163401 [Guillardia theta CCMP2712]|mmetsp:Transcript_6926/g.24269  ORF Transcript_6926/g.24269 Transcript_6926/m.24269 type:complete len:1669 (+) Transcript_6926:367-5373(+)|eukprot:XP_005831995.1 hypothetical protein GUITHDRAFT_163401 [Guillardia theta CCMP2712]